MTPAAARPSRRAEHVVLHTGRQLQPWQRFPHGCCRAEWRVQQTRSRVVQVRERFCKQHADAAGV
jgi:hypothetical protein